MGADAATAKPRPSDVFFGGKNRAVPLALPRARGCVSTSIREPENREVRLRTRMRQRVGTPYLRKPSVKCAECPNRRFLPVTDEVIRWHLSGRDDVGQPFVAGVYPMLLDETCLFLAVDFDKRDWLEDSTAFIETCRSMDLSTALERSRSGRGGHVWLFFEEAVPAALARKLGSYLLTEAMEGRPDLGLDSYDRLFPSQDTMPRGGFGNLIALPLTKEPRELGNRVLL